jgi:hypothetical protein
MSLTSAENVLHLVARLAAVGVCLGCLELLSHGVRRRAPAPAAAAQWGAWGWHAGLPILAAGRLALTVLLLADVPIGLSWKSEVAGVFLLSLLVGRAQALSLGADAQLTAITYGAISLTLLSDTPVAAVCCLYFLTLQLCFAYFAAGYHKLRSPAWREGSALPGILSARVFGLPALGDWLGRHRLLAGCCSWPVVLWEVSFPVVLVAPGEVCWVYCACGVLFHLSTAFTMGLNKFVWAFLALYPAAIYCTAGTIAGGG